MTREREVWAHHVREHIADMRLRPPRLERPIETYISGDLERLLLVWKSAELGWLPKGHSPARQRELLFGRGQPLGMSAVGGRRSRGLEQRWIGQNDGGRHIAYTCR